MTPETKKKFNVMAGSTFAALGLISFAVAAYVASVPAPAKPAPVSPAPIVSVSSCRDVLTQLGYSATLSSGGGITAKDGSLSDPEAALVKATAAIGLCKLPLDEFCMGSECAEPGLTFTLKGGAQPPAEAAEKPASAASAAKKKK